MTSPSGTDADAADAAPLSAVPTPREDVADGGSDAPPAEPPAPGRFDPYVPDRRQALWLLGGAAAGLLLGGGGVAWSKRSPATTRDDEESVSSREALDLLTEGNARFVAGHPARPDQSVERREAVAGGQSPFATILTCADSRVTPELLFDQGLGDLYVVRSLGPVLDEAVLGSLEYGVDTLGVPLLVVLGHTQCGIVNKAVDAVTKAAKSSEPSAEHASHVDGVRIETVAHTTDESSDHSGTSDDPDDTLDSADEVEGADEEDTSDGDTTEAEAAHDAPSSDIDSLIESIVPAVHEAQDIGAKKSELAGVTVDVHVERVVEALKKAPVLRDASLRRKVRVVGGTYDVKTGEVTWA
ncbi:carbonic anhydrase [Spongisporangium articulatum]|uniref:carbonic anhydrase n=1 Tax=Spongisporangium articulatum TaxID=3362603 RepID=A0ABW8AT70_9ACTN